MEIYLIRHTKPLVGKGLIYGRSDVALAGSFSTEAAAVLKQLPEKIDAIYSSPSSRCTLLAGAIVAASGFTGRSYVTDEALYELNFGDWEGQTWDTIDRAASEAWMKDFVHLSPPNGETMLGMEQRIFRFWDKLLQEPYATVCIVTHGGVIRTILARYRATPLKDSFSIPVAMGEVFRLSV